MTDPEHRAIPVNPETTYSLRQQVLSREPTAAELRGEVDDWGHYAVIIDDVVLATGVTHPQSPPPILSQPPAHSWRIIGMAALPDHRGRGLGTLVLAALLSHSRAAGGRYVWCHARIDAAGFYRRHGFAVLHAPKDDPVAGRQVLMGRAA